MTHTARVVRNRFIGQAVALQSKIGLDWCSKAQGPHEWFRILMNIQNRQNRYICLGCGARKEVYAQTS